MKVSKNCKNCGKEFSRVESKGREGRSKYCSKKCHGEATAKSRGWDGIPWSEKSKEYHRKYSKKWHEDNPIDYKALWDSVTYQKWLSEYKKTDEYKKASQIKRNKFRYGVVSNQWIIQKLDEQDGSCPICGMKLVFVEGGLREKKDYFVHIDHNHKTGNLRGLLSGKCNTVIECFEEDTVRLRSAIGYLYGNRKEFFSKVWNGYKSDAAWRHIKSKYKLHQKGWIRLWESQGGKCLICETESDHLEVDHDHKHCDSFPTCGECIRGLLCKRCNTGLGQIADNTAWLTNAITYLELYSEAESL